MCIAAIVYETVSKEHLNAMEEDNPHGGGVAWQNGDIIEFRRGLTAAQIWDMQDTGEMTRPYLLHFRWATHGAKVPQLTHPFPLGVRALWGELSGSSDGVLIHNGTWGDWTTRAMEIPLPRPLIYAQSDTAIAAYFAEDEEDVLDGVSWATAIARMRDGHMDVTTRGTWYRKHGNWYSNLNWLPANRISRFWYSYEDYTEGKYASGIGTPYRVPRLPDEPEDAYSDDGYKGPPDRADYPPEDWEMDGDLVSEDAGVVNAAVAIQNSATKKSTVAEWMATWKARNASYPAWTGMVEAKKAFDEPDVYEQAKRMWRSHLVDCGSAADAGQTQWQSRVAKEAA